MYKKILALDSFGKVELSDGVDRKLVVKAVGPRATGLETRDLVNLQFEKKILACRGKMERVYLNKLVEHCEKIFRYNIMHMC